MRHRYKVSLAALSVVSVSLPFAAHSQEEALEEIVITAQKQTENIMKASASVSVIEGDKIAGNSLTSLEDVLKDVPNVSTNSIGFGSTITIRGLGQDLPPTSGEGAVSTTYDGAYSSDISNTLFGYYDVDRVEVLRGPQGTLYGRNSTGGAVNVISKNPDTAQLGGYALFGLSNYNGIREEGAVNLPLSGTTAVRLSGTNVNRQGYMYDVNGNRLGGDAVGTGLRGKFLYQPSDDLSLTLIFGRSIINGKSPDIYTSTTNFNAGYPYLTNSADALKTFEDIRSNKYSANLVATAGPGVLTVIPDYETSTDRSNPYDPSNPNSLPDSPNNNDQKQRSLEARYASKPEAPFKWQVGGYYYHNENERAPAPGQFPLGLTYGGTTKAAFGQVTVPFTSSFRGIVGLRYSDDEVVYNNPSLALSTNESAHFKTFNWKVGAELDLSDEVLGYLTVATGSRPGGFNDVSGINAGYSATFDKEKVTSGELGLKGRFLDQKLQVTSAVFYYDYKNYQAVDVFVTSSGFTADFFNAPKARDYGAEVDAEMLVGEATHLKASATYLSAKYTSDFFLHSDPFSAPTNLNGLSLPRAPKLSFNAGVEQTFNVGSAKLSPNISARWVDSQYTAPFPSDDSFAKSYTVVDANVPLSPSSGTWTLNAYGSNLFNRIYKTSYAQGGNVGAGQPRMYGVTLNVKF